MSKGWSDAARAAAAEARKTAGKMHGIEGPGAAQKAEQLFVRGKGHKWPSVTPHQLREKGLTPERFSQIARRGEIHDAYSGRHSGIMLNGKPWVLK